MVEGWLKSSYAFLTAVPDPMVNRDRDKKTIEYTNISGPPSLFFSFYSKGLSRWTYGGFKALLGVPRWKRTMYKGQKKKQEKRVESEKRRKGKKKVGFRRLGDFARLGLFVSLRVSIFLLPPPPSRSVPPKCTLVFLSLCPSCLHSRIRGGGGFFGAGC